MDMRIDKNVNVGGLTPLANRFKGSQAKDIPERYIIRRYGNKTGSYLLMVDGSKLWIDPADGECLWFIG